MKLKEFENGLPITEREILALKIYQGAGPIDRETGKRYTTRAYRTINAMLYPGVENEIERVFKDDEALEVRYIEDAEELLEIWENLYSVSYKSSTNMEEEEYGVRIDRASSVEKMKKGGEILSNFSVSTNGQYNISFTKDKTALEQVGIKPKTICVDINNVLKEESYYANEDEILVMPFNKVTVEEKELNGADKIIKNVKGNKAETKVCVTIEPPTKAKPLTEEEYKDKERAMKSIKDKSKRENAEEFLRDIQFEQMAGHSEKEALKNIKEEEINDYIEFKRNLRTIFMYTAREKQLEIDEQLEEIQNKREQRREEIRKLTEDRNLTDLEDVIGVIKTSQRGNMLKEFEKNIEKGS